MPPNAPYGQQYGQSGYTGQPLPQQQPQAPYGPPAQPATGPYYGTVAPAQTPQPARQLPARDPSAWQRQARAAVQQTANGGYPQPMAQPPAPQYGPATYPQAPAQQPAAYGYAAQPMAQSVPQFQPQQAQPMAGPAAYPAQPQVYPGPQPGVIQPTMGQFAQPQQLPQPQYTYGQRPGKRWPFSFFGNKRNMTAGLVVLGVVGAMGGATFIANLGFGAGNGTASIVLGDGEKITAEQLFKNSLANGMQTKSYSQKVTADGLQVERKVDVSVPKTTRLSGSATLSDRNTVVEVYATANDTYAKLIKSDLLTAKPTLQGTWLQARKGGKVLETPAVSPSLFELLFTPPTSLYDPFVIGNYSVAERQALQKITDEQLVYRFDPSSVIQSTINGQDASEFTVTVSASGRQALAAKAAELAGVSAERITEARMLAQLAGNANVSLSVAVSNKDQRIIQVKEAGDKPRVTTYGGYGNTVPAQGPSAAAAWDAAFR